MPIQRRHQISSRTIRTRAYHAALGALLLATLPGCRSGSGIDASSWESDRASEDALRGVERAEASVASTDARPKHGDRAPVVLNGTPIPWSAFQPTLAEAAGRAVVDEVLLDRLLDRELAREGLSIDQRDIDAEYDELVRVLRENVAGGGAERVVSDVRRNLGLGPTRFAATLERNAKLRALVRDRVEVTDRDIELAHRIDHGPRHRVRLLTVASRTEASKIRRDLAGRTGSDLRVAFAERAMAASTDASAATGGLIEPMSTADPAYPTALSQAVASLGIGQLSTVVALPDAYALIYKEAELPPTGRQLGQVREALRRDVRSRRERLAMERLAEQLLGGATITVLDPSLGWASDR